MTRIEKDFIGSVKIPKNALYGIHSLRASQNFPITKRGLDPIFIKNIALVKKACALTNKENKDLEENKADAIIKACDEIIEGKHLASWQIRLIVMPVSVRLLRSFKEEKNSKW